MIYLIKYWLFIGVIVLVVALVGVSLQYVSAKDPVENPDGIQITNDAENPIPLSLSLEVLGISDVTVANIPLPVTGAVDANITNESLPVEVNNSAENPVLVSDVSGSAIEPFAWTGDNSEILVSNVFDVPSDKMLVIEFVSIRSEGDDILAIWSLYAYTDSIKYQYPLETTVIEWNDLVTFWQGTHVVKVYADPGSTVSFGLNNSSGYIIAMFSISGYLVDAPPIPE